MSKVIIDNQFPRDLARLLRKKSAVVGKIRLSEMIPAVSSLHGYHSEARAMSSEPSAFFESAFVITQITPTASAVKRRDFLHAEPVTEFDIDSSLSFVAAATRTE